MKSSDRNRSDNLWAITSYFNPMGYQRRLVNYRLFREHLKVPLVAVELSFGSEYKLEAGDADVLIQLRGGDVLWQKERLLNLALQALPAACRKVVWVDCDVIFETDDWSERVSSLLERSMIMQTFSYVHYMPPEWTPGKREYEAEYTQSSIAFDLASGTPAVTSMLRLDEARWSTHAPGFSWAARRELLDEYGFYDACVVGGGDRAMACAAYGFFHDLIERFHMNERQANRYLAWAKPYYQAVQAPTSFLDCNLFHLWHGDLRNRRPRDRHKGFERFNFNPFEDIAIDATGCWRWNTNKPDMHEYVRNYFASRREDG
jgi:hypothetical protein